MNHYDDLQRFQEKTRTQNLKFQDLSSQAATREHGDWAILNQLNPGAEKPSSLALGGSVSAPLPQSVPADLFHQIEAAPQPAVETATAAPEPVRQEPAVTPAPSIPAPEPAMAPPRIAPRPAPAAENYAHLFAAKSAEPVTKNKDQPLKSLLERIATCR
ncbi:cellulose biosynthesis protein BcsO [Klebsiella variicola]|uniref:cellulose biosynthesis protein BcsO n=1 Tax=Klebsiella variicola TaxID=244366 RepID=UPI00292AD04A|nr:cellulose biosynthesis protein BcsO [Klebsiella variicola]MDV0911073.1 cellulose biosynthesis protein BcsO [Klebsiella variicola subsp. variicola]